MINNSGLNFYNLDGDNQSKSDETKSFSLTELLAGHNHADEDHHEHEHDFANSNSSSDSNSTSASAAIINAPTAQIDVNYYGFTEEAENAFEYAVTIWEGWIDSDVAIEVDAYWEDLSQYGSGVLGAASPYSFKRNFDGATEDNTYYAMPLANHLAGKDLNGSRSEIETWFNSGFSNWYFGTDGNAPKGKYDFTTVVLHELAHGFGFTDFIDFDNGIGSYGNTIYENFIVNGDNQTLSSFSDNSKELGAQLTSNDLFFNGANAIEANGGEKVKLYAPTKWELGSSIAHTDETTYPKGGIGSLMTPYFSSAETVHTPDAITLGILEDLGWDINKVENLPATPKETLTTPPKETTVTPPEETPVTQANVINFEEDKITSYAGQDKDSILTISDNNQQIEIQGNGWKKLAFDYQVTEETILEFEFRSDIIGEIQGIGFDTNDKLTNSDKNRIFQLEGTDNLGISQFKNHITGQGWKTYQITVGDYFTGNFNYLTFINDHDGGKKNAVSQYRNLRLYEEGQQVTPVEVPTTPPKETPVVPPAEVPATPTEETPTTQANVIKIEEDKITSYAGQDKDSILTISDNNQQIEIQGNGWKKLAFDYQVTEETILEFEFRSDIIGEIQGIGFDTNDKLTNSDKNRIFQLEGTDNLGIRDFTNQITGQGWKTYQITVGDYFTGNFNYLTFINDHDNGDKNAVSQYRNLNIYEGNKNQFSRTEIQENLNSDVVLTVNDSTNNYTLSSYGGTTQDKGIFSISDDKAEIEITGNSWKKLDINNYNVTENTVLKFDFQSNTEAEIQGIGFDNDDTISGSDENHLFQVAGTQDWGIEIEDYTLGSGWKTYEIKVGEHISGEFNYLTLANDHDISNSTAQSQFRNISLFEM